MKRLAVLLIAMLGTGTARAEGFSLALHAGFPILAGVSVEYRVLEHFGVRVMLSPGFAGVDALAALPISGAFNLYSGLGVGISLVDFYSLNGRQYSPLAWQIVLGVELRFDPFLRGFLEFTPTFLSFDRRKVPIQSPISGARFWSSALTWACVIGSDRTVLHGLLKIKQNRAGHRFRLTIGSNAQAELLAQRA